MSLRKQQTLTLFPTPAVTKSRVAAASRHPHCTCSGSGCVSGGNGGEGQGARGWGGPACSLHRPEARPGRLGCPTTPVPLPRFLAWPVSWGARCAGCTSSLCRVGAQRDSPPASLPGPPPPSSFPGSRTPHVALDSTILRINSPSSCPGGSCRHSSFVGLISVAAAVSRSERQAAGAPPSGFAPPPASLRCGTCRRLGAPTRAVFREPRCDTCVLTPHL